MEMKLSKIMKMEEEEFVKEVIEAGAHKSEEAFNSGGPLKEQLKKFEEFSQKESDYESMRKDVERFT